MVGRKGVIALDIDGTVTRADHTIPVEVSSFLEQLGLDGWQIAFVTGRSFAYGFDLLQTLSFDYLFACENGATLLEMPERRVIHTLGFEMDRLPILEEVAAQFGTDILIHSGVEEGGQCYWRPDRFAEPLRSSLERRKGQTSEPWVALSDFSEAPIDHFVYVKCFGDPPMLRAFERELMARADWAISIISNPLDRSHHIALITHPDAGKGGAVRYLREHYAEGGPVIAAGDDLNDLPMLREADVAIAMGGAPKELLEVADILAAPSDQMGIIEAVTGALK